MRIRVRERHDSAHGTWWEVQYRRFIFWHATDGIYTRVQDAMDVARCLQIAGDDVDLL